MAYSFDPFRTLVNVSWPSGGFLFVRVSYLYTIQFGMEEDYYPISGTSSSVSIPFSRLTDSFRFVIAPNTSPPLPEFAHLADAMVTVGPSRGDMILDPGSPLRLNAELFLNNNDAPTEFFDGWSSWTGDPMPMDMFLWAIPDFFEGGKPSGHKTGYIIALADSQTVGSADPVQIWGGTMDIRIELLSLIDLAALGPPVLPNENWLLRVQEIGRDLPFAGRPYPPYAISPTISAAFVTPDPEDTDLAVFNNVTEMGPDDLTEGMSVPPLIYTQWDLLAFREKVEENRIIITHYLD